MDWQTFSDNYIRTFLSDTSANPRWTDTELLRYINLAVNDFSTYFPVEKSYQYTPSASSEGLSFTLPTDILEVLLVEHPAGTFWEEASDHPAERFAKYGRRYTISDTETGAKTITMIASVSEGTAININYAAYRTEIVNTTDSVPAPRAAYLALVYFSAMLCHERVTTQDVNLSRWNDGRRNDSPVLPEAERLRQNYLREIDKLRSTFHQLYRRGARS